MTDRHLIVFDVETTGLLDSDVIVEVAALDTDTGEELYFIPHVSHEHLHAESARKGLEINGYWDRGLDKIMLSPEDTTHAYQKLSMMLDGNFLAGSNPAFDDRHLIAVLPRVWFYRMPDLASYSAGRLGLGPKEVLSLHSVCERLGVGTEFEHSAMGDVKATAECFRRLSEIVVTASVPTTQSV